MYYTNSQDLLTGFPKSDKLDKLHSFFIDQKRRNSTSTPTRRSDYRRTEEVEDEWTTWDENWDRVVYRGILNSHLRQHIASNHSG
jgi:beta-1,4-mannosyltransferase